MLCLLPLMRGRAKLRVWLALMAACGFAWVFQSVAAHIAIDILAGALVLKRPSGVAQKIIGFLFVAMILFSTGYLLSAQGNPLTVQAIMIVLGWLQWIALLSWGIYDLARDRRGGSRPAGSVSAAETGRIR